jgi:hypothetical protein
MAKKRSSMEPKSRSKEVETHRGKPIPGKHAAKGVAYDPSIPLPQAAATALAGPVNERPRPAKTRYPIDMETFAELKGSSAKEAVSLKKGASVLTLDTSKKVQELALAAPGMAAPLAAEPAAAPVAMTNFQGITATGWLPPDCTMAVGPQNVLLAVNGGVSIYAKTGGAAQLGRRLDLWFSNVITNAKVFDPKALYDQHAGRWVLLAVALPNDQAVKESFFLLSVSKTSDPLGGWFNYKIDATKDGTTATDNWADYPAIGLDNQAFYLTANMFKFNGSFQYAKLRIIPKGPAYVGSPLTFTDFTKLKNADGSLCFTVQPCHTFGAPNVQHLVNSYFPTSASPTQNRLTLWSLTDPLTTPALAKRTVSTDPYSLPPDADQKGGGTPIDSGDVRVLNAVFRGGSVWTTLSTSHDWGDGIGVAACHWFQANATSGLLVQQGVYGARKSHYFYPAVMPDTNGNMTMVFCRSGASEFASVRYSGRKSSDPLGSLQSSSLLKSGVAAYVGLDGLGRNRWGDYAGIGVDPQDGRLVWFYSMYAASPANTWGTWVGSARF